MTPPCGTVLHLCFHAGSRDSAHVRDRGGCSREERGECQGRKGEISSVFSHVSFGLKPQNTLSRKKRKKKLT